MPKFQVILKMCFQLQHLGKCQIKPNPNSVLRRKNNNNKEQPYQQQLIGPH